MGDTPLDTAVLFHYKNLIIETGKSFDDNVDEGEEDLENVEL